MLEMFRVNRLIEAFSLSLRFIGVLCTFVDLGAAVGGLCYSSVEFPEPLTFSNLYLKAGLFLYLR